MSSRRLSLLLAGGVLGFLLLAIVFDLASGPGFIFRTLQNRLPPQWFYAIYDPPPGYVLAQYPNGQWDLIDEAGKPVPDANLYVQAPEGAAIWINGRKAGTVGTGNKPFAHEMLDGPYVVEAVLPLNDTLELYARGEGRFVAGPPRFRFESKPEPDHLLTLTPDKQRFSALAEQRLRQKLASASVAPEMLAMPAGNFLMGCEATERFRPGDLEEGCTGGPQRRVSLPAFEIGRTAVTYDDWDACALDGGCAYIPPSPWQSGHYGFGEKASRGDRAVAFVSWRDITEQYLPWLNRKTGRHYRLPSEAEWEYAARRALESPEEQPSYELYSQVLEWVEDCREPEPGLQPPSDTGSCARRVVRGGGTFMPLSEANVHRLIGHRGVGEEPGDRHFLRVKGFRIARTLP